MAATPGVFTWFFVLFYGARCNCLAHDAVTLTIIADELTQPLETEGSYRNSDRQVCPVLPKDRAGEPAHRIKAPFGMQGRIRCNYF